MKFPSSFIAAPHSVTPQVPDQQPGRRSDRHRELPAFIRTVLCQLAKLRYEHAIPAELFDRQIARITREELEPRALAVLVRDLSDGRTRLLIKQKPTGDLQDLIEYPNSSEDVEDDDAGRQDSSSPERQH